MPDYDTKLTTKKTDAPAAPRSLAPAPKAADISPALAKRARDLMAHLEAHTQRAEALLDDGAAATLPDAEVDSIRERIARARSDLQAAALRLPSGHPLMMKSFASTERATTAIAKLDSISRALQARAATTAEAAHGAQHEIFEAAAKKTPQGYCDLADTPQTSAPCQLGHARRQSYRQRVRDAVNAAQISWTAAINALQIAEKLNRGEISFEKQLGQLLFGVLFDVFTNAAKNVANKAVRTGAKSLSSAGDIYPGLVESPDADAIAMTKNLANHGITKSWTAFESSMKSGITAQQLEERGKPSAPTDRAHFLEAIQSAPTIWSDNINSNLDQLFDADLAALHVGLPRPAELTQQVFKERLELIMKRFDAQVTPVNGIVRPVNVVSSHGMLRAALVRPDTQPNQSLKGEWRGAPTKTGRWTFIRWIDDDMRAMALDRAVQGGGPLEATTIRRSNDETYWDAESLAVLQPWDIGSISSTARVPPDASADGP